jgi:hypothetical protein
MACQNGKWEVRYRAKSKGIEMKIFKIFVTASAVIVFGICLYSFLLGNKVFEGEFENDALAWYFLAKGIFCSLALYLLLSILGALVKRKS